MTPPRFTIAYGYVLVAALLFGTLRVIHIAMHLANLAAVRSAIWGEALPGSIGILLTGYR